MNPRKEPYYKLIQNQKKPTIVTNHHLFKDNKADESNAEPPPAEPSKNAQIRSRKQ